MRVASAGSGTSEFPNAENAIERRDVFRRLVEAQRPQLRAHCHSIVGTDHDADDATQETLLRAWRGFARFEGRSSLRTWLYRIATNACIDLIAARNARGLPIGCVPAADLAATGGHASVEPAFGAELRPAVDSAPLEARYERREEVELAFAAALKHLPPHQFAVLVMRQVLGFSARETAESLETTRAAVNSGLQRARKTVAERISDEELESMLLEPETTRLQDRAEDYVDALERVDVDGLVGMLVESSSA
jgi:RNA polymerase sigma-70 factor, ECF subfamily